MFSKCPGRYPGRIVQIAGIVFSLAMAFAMTGGSSAAIAAPTKAPSGLLVGLDGKCLDVLEANTANGAPVVIFDCHGQENQQWQFVDIGAFDEVRGLGGKCLQVGTEPGDSGFLELVMGSCGGLEDRWMKDYTYTQGYYDPSFVLLHISTGLCADVLHADSSNRTPVVLFDCDGRPNQKWAFEQTSPGCTSSLTSLCLNGDRFQVTIEWQDFVGNTGPGMVVPAGSDDSGLFWFFDADNWEMLVKVLDGCGINGYYWTFAAATTNVQYTLRVVDTQTGVEKRYTNPLGVSAAAITDIRAFATCP